MRSGWSAEADGDGVGHEAAAAGEDPAVAVVLDGSADRVVHYVNGITVGENALRVKPPFRIGAAELGNWNANGFPKADPFIIRNFSGAMDEFCLFSRALDPDEIRALYSTGRPQPDPLIRTRN